MPSLQTPFSSNENPFPALTGFTSVTLLGRVKDLSDQAAWDIFVRRYAPRIFSWCKRLSLQDHDAFDVTQQVLMKLVNAMEAFEYDPQRGSFRGWLKTVTANSVRDLGRKKSSGVIVGESAEAWLEELSSEDAIDDLTDQIESGYREQLLEEAESRAQLRLKPRTWKIYTMLTKQTMSAANVARELDIKLTDVYVAKSRAIKMLSEIVALLEKQN